MRMLSTPADPGTEAQLRARYAFGASSQSFGLKLTEDQRQRWNDLALTVPSHPWLGRYSHLSGQQLEVKINSTLRCVGQQPVLEPPQLVAFSPNHVGQLTADYDQNGALRLRLAIGTAVEDIMLFGQAPCSAGRMKHRRVCYLGLSGPATDGQCDITAPYIARYGQPRPGQKIFVVTCQHKNGWKGQDRVTSAIVPPQPLPGKAQGSQKAQAKPAAAAPTVEAQPAPAKGVSPLSRAVYKGSTPDAPRLHSGQKHDHPWSILRTPLVHGFRLATARLGVLGLAGIRA